jgi:long-chain acyl-CoA synthetase
MQMKKISKRQLNMARIALIGKNSIEYISLLIDIWKNGDCVVLIDWHIPYQTAIEMMKEANVKTCYLQDGLWEGAHFDDDVDITVFRYPTSKELTFTLPSHIYEKFNANYSGSEAVIIYSSGTTGKSKGVILSHFAINTNADAIIEYMNLSISDCIYTIRSLSHSSTLTGELLVALKAHTKLLVTSSAVPPRYILDTITRNNVTILCLNPTLLSFLCDELSRKPYCISSLRVIYSSGAILSDSIYKKAKAALNNTPVYNAYGLSETSPRLTVQTKDCCETNSVGRPIQGVEIAIIDENGKMVSSGERGIVHVKTPCLFSGYVIGGLKHTSLCDGWFNTGDIGFFDEFGELHIVGRIDDVIVCDAHKVYPIDIERRVMEVPGVIDCAVSKCTFSGVDMIGCIYVARSDCTMEIIKHLKKNLLPYEIPKRVLAVQSIPYNSRGKKDMHQIEVTLSKNVQKEF